MQLQQKYQEMMCEKHWGLQEITKPSSLVLTGSRVTRQKLCPWKKPKEPKVMEGWIKIQDIPECGCV